MSGVAAARSPWRTEERRKRRVTLRFIAWIWHVRGQVPLADGQDGEEAFERLDSLFRQPGTSHARTGDTLTFEKQDAAAQDKMSIFDRGTLRVEPGVAGLVLRYELVSRALLLCFLAPLLFLTVAQVTHRLILHERARTEAESKAGKDKHKPKKPDKVLPLNPVDKFLGAPAPDDPSKKKKDEKRNKDKLSTTPAYVFAGIFAVLYMVGRVLEAWLIRSLFRKRLLQA